MRKAVALFAVVLLAGVSFYLYAADGPAKESKPMAGGTVKVRLMQADGTLSEPVEVPKVVKTDEEWKKVLTPEQFRVVRSSGTERPFCGALLDNKKDGVYACVACGLPLFASNSKFN